MSLPFTSVVSLHTDPYSCGVAKFSRQLAERLGVPFLNVRDRRYWGSFPLFSLKASEFDCRDVDVVPGPDDYAYGVFWHDAGYELITGYASVVFYADPSLGPNGLWCPSLIKPAPLAPLRLFSFGMAHKVQVPHFERVRDLLDREGVPFHLRVSVGLHEGTSLSDATGHFERLKECLGPERVTILGILSDEAVAVELRDADGVLAFFEHGVRANNTTVHAALESGNKVVTNHDRQTPGFLKAATRDIMTMDSWGTSIPYHYSWDNLIARMTELYAATAHR